MQYNRRGFSLIELLIVVAIIAALVGLAVPLFRSYLYEAQQARALQDMDIIETAIHRYDGRESTPFAGHEITPLRGRYLVEISPDPWGNNYFLDANLGVIGTFGGDGMLRGEGRPDIDIVDHYKKGVLPIQAYYEGPYGVPGPENRIVIRTSKVFFLDTGLSDPAPEPDPTPASDLLGDDVELFFSGEPVGVSARMLGFYRDRKRTRPGQAWLALKCCTNPNENIVPRPPTYPLGYRLRVNKSTRVDLSPLSISISEGPSPGGPLVADAHRFIYGPLPYAHDGRGMPLKR